MNITLIILVAEVVVVCLAMVAVLFYLRWKKKKNKTAEFGVLLDNVSQQEIERKAYLVKHLVDEYGIKSEEATETGEYMVEAEKQFLQQFIKQQIEGAPVTDFHQNLCELLDQYLYFVPTLKVFKENLAAEVATQAEAAVDKSEAEPSWDEALAESGEKAVEETKTEVENKEQASKAEEEPDWGDAFSESGDAVDESTKAGFDAENKEKASDAEEEPDWGDAFSESGDAVDEATKSGFDAEKKG